MSQDQGQSASRKKKSTGREWSDRDTDTIKRLVNDYPHADWETLQKVYAKGKYELSRSYSPLVIHDEVKARWKKIAERTIFTPEQWMILCKERDSKDQTRRSYSRIWLDYFPNYTKKTLELKYRSLSDEDIKNYLKASANSQRKIARTEPPGGYALNMIPEDNAKYVYATWLEGKERREMNDDQYLHTYFLKYGFKNLTINAISQFVKRMKKTLKPVPRSIPAIPTIKGIWWNHENLNYLKNIVENELKSVFHGDWKTVLEYRFEGLGLNHTMLSQKYTALRSGKAMVNIDVRINPANLNLEKQNKVFERAHGLKKIVWDSANDDFALAYYSYCKGKRSHIDTGVDGEVFLKRHDFTDTLTEVYDRGSELKNGGSKPSGKEIDLRAGPPGKYLMDLKDWEFHEWLCDTSDHNPGEITDLMKYHMPRCANEPAEIYDLRRHMWDTTGHEDIECPLKFTKNPTTKTSKNTNKTSSSRTKPSSSRETSQRTDSQDNRDLYEVTPPPKSSRSKQPAEGYASGGWTTVNKPASEQRRHSPSRSNEPESRTASLAFRPSPSSGGESHNEASRSSRSRTEPHQSDRRQEPTSKSRTSDSNTSRSVAKRPARSPARSPERKDGSKRTKDGIDPIRR
ncbi:hypothetical protein BELL_1065g00030 [Botrytis elliptica]|uniref:Uncharacterized protein n=1 Tax=Botrytis elliptica TaxID=278938 RepID=A0A4Z1IR12_9HELO|nr:hypothetical protein EAE99_003864 [Botrytis elliptica]TGO63796.1 hypothetical protein BELL_1065g00030 [Botrytis elliptica]